MTAPTRVLNRGIVSLIRHRAINLRDASGRAAVECHDLLHNMLGPEEVLELVEAWLVLHERKKVLEGGGAVRGRARLPRRLVGARTT